MNHKFALIALVAAAAATSAFADDITIDPNPLVSTRTRAEVQAELAQFKQAGVNPWAMIYDPVKYCRSANTHAQVRQEFQASREVVRAMTGEDSGSCWLAAHPVQGAGTNLARR